MSILNKMHQGLNGDEGISPTLSVRSEKTGKKKALLLLLTFLLLLTSIGLSYLIYEKQNNSVVINNRALIKNTDSIKKDVLTSHDLALVSAKKEPIQEHKALVAEDIQSEVNNLAIDSSKVEQITQPNDSITQPNDFITEPASPTQSLTAKISRSSNTQGSRIGSVKTKIINKTNRKDESSEIQDNVRVFETVLDIKVIQPTQLIEAKKPIEQVNKVIPVKQINVDNKVEATKAVDNKPNNTPNTKLNATPDGIANKSPKPEPLKLEKKPLPKQSNKDLNNQSSKPQGSFLQVTTSSLTAEDLANIHLKKANQAIAKDDVKLAAQEKNLALELKPDLHDIRTSLALYYYGAGEEQRATTVLKKGVLQFPEYADFSLMLARIAIKEGDQQKAYLYLNQHPPKVKGNLDYHVNYAILAQKFKKYAQSESLYRGLLTQRPDNGRWIMSLAIAQDKQGKIDSAITNYQKALMKIDLSNKAKQYINQRLLYLKSQ